MFLVGKIAGSILWGILIALALVGVVVLIVNSLNSNKKMGGLSLLVVLAMLVGVGFQSCFMMGAFKVKHQAKRVEASARQVAQVGQTGLGGLLGVKWGETLEDLSDLSQVAGELLDIDRIDLSSSPDAISAVTRAVHSRMNTYILYRILWMLGILLLGGVLTGVTMERVGTATRARPTGYGSPRSADDF